MFITNYWFMASQQGLEPRTLALEGPYSIQLSYCDIWYNHQGLFAVSKHYPVVRLGGY